MNVISLVFSSLELQSQLQLQFTLTITAPRIHARPVPTATDYIYYTPARALDLNNGMS